VSFETVRFPALVLFGCALSVCPTARAEVPDQFRDIRKRTEDRLAKEKVPSVAVAVAKDGKVLNGSITASEIPGQRVITLSHWMEVRRKP
jgi:hypothetical protein